MWFSNMFKKKTEISPNVQKPKNEHGKATSVQSNTFICARCKAVLPMKYMHKQGVCADCISQSPNDHISIQTPKKQNENICVNEPGAKTSQERRKQNESICLFYHKEDEYEWYQVELRFNENNEISIVDTYYWPAHRGASNGGQATTKLDSDYFTNNSISDFIAFLTSEYKIVKKFNQDFSHLKNRDDVNALFRKKE